MYRLALTTGEPAGIGPDLALMQADKPREHELVAIGDRQLLLARASELGLSVQLRSFDPTAEPQRDPAGSLCILHSPTAVSVTTGELNSANARYVLNTLDLAVDGCKSGLFDAMITAPVHKGVINDAGIGFTGHTEYLAERTAGDPVMVLAAGDFRVALATTHLPLANVAASITEATLTRVLYILHNDLTRHFGITHPHILVCGLNPHAGEGGHLGMEEINFITPTIEKLNKQGLNLTGPLPADTLFTPQHLDGADAVLAMFHDQGLPVLKYAGFGEAVNVTFGLPIIRTSVDHGTAIDKAGTGNINSGSLHAAITMATQMAGAAQARMQSNDANN